MKHIDLTQYNEESQNYASSIVQAFGEAEGNFEFFKRVPIAKVDNKRVFRYLVVFKSYDISSTANIDFYVDIDKDDKGITYIYTSYVDVIDMDEYGAVIHTDNIKPENISCYRKVLNTDIIPLSYVLDNITSILINEIIKYLDNLNKSKREKIDKDLEFLEDCSILNS